MFVKIKSSGGFTLVEILVAGLIMAIALTFAGGILLASFNLTSHSAAVNEAKMIGDTVYNRVSEKLIYVANLQIEDGQDTSTAPKYGNSMRVVGGRLLVKTGSGQENNFYGDDFYGGKDIRLSVQALGSDTVRLTVEVLEGDKVHYHTGSTVKLLNIVPTKGSISGVTGSELKNPKLIYSEAGDSGSGVVS